ncbi:MAG: hypothetical protein QG646_627 [Euryarchaeota archaeon]|nr:hypothetical protein [Euryarchaeota archaeon]
MKYITKIGKYIRLKGNFNVKILKIKVNKMSKIPIFVSCPTQLNPEQDKKRKIILKLLDSLQLEPRALGRGDYPKDFPLKEVYVIAKHCGGGIILGFEQIFISNGLKKRGTDDQKPIKSSNPICLPTPWNHLEAGILYGLKLPLLIFKEDSIEGGVFDIGITDAFVQKMPPEDPTPDKLEELMQVFLKWYGEVCRVYYE